MKVILILEDDHRVLDLLCLILATRGYSVVPATTAEQAREHIKQGNPVIDLLIADVVLPISSGIRVAVQLRKQIPGLKILLISGYPIDAWREQDAADVKELPSDVLAILPKPFFPDVLIEKVGHLIGSVEGHDLPHQHRPRDSNRHSRWSISAGSAKLE